jgi:hypothetical protein
MNATQSFKIYEILQKHFKNDADAKALVAEIEEVIEGKIAAKKDVLATKEDISRLEVLFEKRFNSLVMWLVGTALVTVGLIFTVIKLFIVK